jgi:hypothetical protein
MPRPDVSQRLALRRDRLTAKDNVVENFAAAGVATVQTKLIGEARPGVVGDCDHDIAVVAQYSAFDMHQISRGADLLCNSRNRLAVRLG